MNEANSVLDEQVLEAELVTIAGSFARSLNAPAIVFLSGELGAGKSTFVRAMLRSLGITGPVKSPTFTLVERYEIAGNIIHHLDLYRLTDSEELEYLGFRDLSASSDILLIEWPEMAMDALPHPTHRVQLAYTSGAETHSLRRRIRIVEYSAR